jgi:hypothetical protein
MTPFTRTVALCGMLMGAAGPLTANMRAQQPAPAFAPAPRVPATPPPVTPPSPPSPPRADPAVPTDVPQPPAPPAPPAPAANDPFQALNVKVDVTIVDQRGSQPPTRKLVSIITGHNLRGSIRSNETFTTAPGVSGGPEVSVPLNIDVVPRVMPGGKVRVILNMEYELPVEAPANALTQPPAARLRKTDIRENLGMVLDSGKPLVVAQSADPVSDRRVTVEVLATILK